MLTIRVPHRLSAQSMYGLLRDAIDENMEPRGNNITLDFSHLSFSDAAGITVIANLIEWLRKYGVTVSHANCNIERGGICYLDDCGFFQLYWGHPLSPYASPRGSTYPFKRLHCSECHQWVDGNVFPWIAKQTGIREGALTEFKTCIKELFNNIHDHSSEEVGCMHLQKYPNAERLKIAVSDFDVGIAHEVRKVKAGATDPYALYLATQEGFTSKADGKNMGAGLSYLIDNVVRRAKGVVEIYSGKGEITFGLSRAGALLHNTSFANGFYPGTLVSMTLRTDMIPNEEDEAGELLW
ncbi:MAG: hypothetical protein P4L57_15260 [Rhizomicrobium sp.]|nr:hypothetical protein [Rhizomicrobium sp.]